jgi:arylsulfatase A-like enzyme
MPVKHESRRNVLFISADQWRGECLSLLGHPVLKTPNLDALAEDGTAFLHHYAQAAPCGPARASMLTGLYAMNHRSVLNGTPLDDRHTNLAREARRGGYDPMLFGYTDTSVDPRGFALEDPILSTYESPLPGFSIGFHYQHEVCPAWLGHLRSQGYELPERLFDMYLPAPGASATPGSGHSRSAPRYRAEDSDTAFTADRLMEYLALRRGEPWFAHAVFLRPHPPLYAPEPYNTLYDPTTVALPSRRASLSEERAQHPFLDFWLQLQSQVGSYSGHPVSTVDLPELRQLRATYFGLITEVDHHIGRVLDYLRSTGEYARTLIVFTVDHGEMLGDHWLFNKGGYFEQSYHIPLIVRDPETPAPARGSRVTAFSEAVDLMPTVLEWLGQDVPVQCDGASLFPFLRGVTPPNWRRSVHWEYDFRDPVALAAEHALGIPSDACNLNVIRDERYKYVHFTALPPLLFDLQADPSENENLARSPEYQSQLLDCAQRLLSWRMRHAERTLANTLLTPKGLVQRRAGRY